MAQSRNGEIGGVEVTRVWFKTNPGTGVAFSAGPSSAQIGLLLATGKSHGEDLTAPADGDIQPLGQRVDNRHADAMQATAVLITLIREFTARVKRRQNHLNPR